MWAKALFEGVFGAKDSSGGIFEDIVEELEAARKNTEDKQAFIELVFNRVFHAEPQHLIDSHQGRIENSEAAIAAEELEETKAFLAKIQPLKLDNFKQEGQIPNTYTSYQLCETADESLA